MIIRNDKPHLGDALMILAMMQDGDVYAGTPECNALLMHNVKTIPVEHCVHWDVDVSDITYPVWEDYAKALGREWNGTYAKLVVTEEEIEACRLPDNGKQKIGVCCWSRDKHRSYPHWKALVKRLKKYGDVYLFGREHVPIRQLVSQVSQCDKLVSVDTGIAHIGGCFGVSLVLIEGPTDCESLYGCYSDIIVVASERNVCFRRPCVYNPCGQGHCLYLLEPANLIELLKVKPVYKQEKKYTMSKKADSTKEKIVIVRLKGIGDILMTWFGLEVLRLENPDAHITYVTSPTCGVLFFGQESLVDQVVISEWEYPPSGIPQLPKEIRNLPADKLIDLTNRVDFHDTIEEALGDRRLLQESSRSDNFAKLMGVNLNGNVRQRWLQLPADIVASAERIIVESGLGEKWDEGKLVSCQLDAEGATRNWHIDRWVQLSKLLVEDGYGVIWFSVTEEHQYLKLGGVINLACLTSLGEMIALMSKCKYAVSTCSASVHIAHRLPKVTPIGIYGSTDYELLGAYYDDLIPVTNYNMDCAPCVDWGHECLGQPGSPWCINQISPREVFSYI